MNGFLDYCRKRGLESQTRSTEFFQSRPTVTSDQKGKGKRDDWTTTATTITSTLFPSDGKLNVLLSQPDTSIRHQAPPDALWLSTLDKLSTCFMYVFCHRRVNNDPKAKRLLLLYIESLWNSLCGKHLKGGAAGEGRLSKAFLLG